MNMESHKIDRLTQVSYIQPGIHDDDVIIF